jgi:multicomponent Na+:H+ antiporter subunit G
MSDLISILVAILYGLGLFFNLAAVVGIIRLPDVYCRLHASSKNTTLGSLLIVLGLVIRQAQNGAYPAVAKLLFIGLLLIMITPIGSHALARAAYLFGVPLWSGTVCDQYRAAGGQRAGGGHDTL